MGNVITHFAAGASIDAIHAVLERDGALIIDRQETARRLA